MSMPGAWPDDPPFSPPTTPPAPPAPPVPSAMPDDMFRDARSVTNNFHEYHRRGRTVDLMTAGREPWIDGLRHPQLALGNTGRLRAPANSSDVYKDADGNYDARALLSMQGRRRGRVLAGAGGSRSAERAKDVVDSHENPGNVVKGPEANAGWCPKDAATRTRRNWFRSKGLDLRAPRHLGAGGIGLATLFDLRSGATAVQKKFVVKAQLDQSSIMPEKLHQVNLRRAPHIPRAPKWRDDIVPDAAFDSPIHQNRYDHVDADPDTLYQEFMKRGDPTNGLVAKVRTASEQVPNSVLWKIFFCLVRACLAMEYPPRRRVQQDGTEIRDSEAGRDILEGNPTVEAERVGYRMVQFDLDPRNVFIGDFDDNHLSAPIRKVSDFGLSEVVKTPEFNTRDNIWTARMKGKTRHFLPEQFHKEWEYLGERPQDGDPVPKFAGNWGPASNIWAIGLILQQMITDLTPPYPPAATGPIDGLDPKENRDGIEVMRDIDGNEVDQFYTHGARLVNHPNIDDDLRILLIRCLADQPAHRPTLQELSTYMERAERLIGWNDDPDDRDWFDRMISEPADSALIDPELALPNRPPDPVIDPPATFIWNFLTSRGWIDPAQAQQTIPPWMTEIRGVVLRLAHAAGAGIDAFQAAWADSMPPLPAPPLPTLPPTPPNADNLAAVQSLDNVGYLFTAQMQPLSANSAGNPVLNPTADRPPISSLRGAGLLSQAPQLETTNLSGGYDSSHSLPSSTASLVDQMRQSNLDAELNPVPAVNGRPPLSATLGALGGEANPVNSQTGAQIGLNMGLDSLPLGSSTNIFLGCHDPEQAYDANGRPASNMRGIVLPLPPARGSTALDTIPIPEYAIAANSPAPPPGYLYGRVSPSPSWGGYVVPEGLFTIRIDPVDPGQGVVVPNIFYREIILGVVAPQAGHTADGGQDVHPGVVAKDGQVARAPTVTAIRISPYGPFQRPPSRPEGFLYGRRLHISATELQVLADRGVVAPPGRNVIRLVHVEPREDNFERPTLFYQMEPPLAQAPPAPSPGNPEPDILYATLPII